MPGTQFPHYAALQPMGFRPAAVCRAQCGAGVMFENLERGELREGGRREAGEFRKDRSSVEEETGGEGVEAEQPVPSFGGRARAHLMHTLARREGGREGGRESR